MGARLTFGFGMVLAITLLIGVVGVYNTSSFAHAVACLGSTNTKGAVYLADESQRSADELATLKASAEGRAATQRVAPLATSAAGWEEF